MIGSSLPRILYISPPWPYESIRSAHVARALQRVGEVTVVLVDAEDTGRWDSIRMLDERFSVRARLGVHVRRVTDWRGRLNAFIDSEALYPHGLGVEDDREQAFFEDVAEFDLVWIFKLRTANMFARRTWAKSVLDVDDLPSGVYRTLRRGVNGLKERLLNEMQILKWVRREKHLGQRFSTLAVCSENDRRQLGRKLPIHVIPNGYTRSDEKPIRMPANPSRIGFIGLFEYFANLEGIRWFAQRCWPQIKMEIPDARLRLVGRGGETLGSLGKDIDVLGWVDDSNAEIATWSAMIVPLHAGGGTRVKIAEGFSRKCPIVSTNVGAYGYDVVNERELLLEDTAEGFARACVSLIRDPETANVMSERAFSAFTEKWTWDAIAPRIWAAAEDGLRRSRTQL